MKRMALLFAMICCLNLFWAQSMVWKSANNFGGAGQDVGTSVAFDSMGNTYVGGSFSGTCSFGNITLTSLGDIDAFLGKISPSGQWLWAITAGGDTTDTLTDIVVDPQGNLYASFLFQGTATFGQDTYTSSRFQETVVAKLDLDGNWIWTTRASSSWAVMGIHLELDNSGSLRLGGAFSGNTNFGGHVLSANNYDGFVCKISSQGEWLWVRIAVGSNLVQPGPISIDQAGNTYLVGNYLGSVTCGAYTLGGTGQKCFLAKLDSSGNWTNLIQLSNYYQELNDIKIAADGSIYIAGSLYNSDQFGSQMLTSNGGDDLLVLKLNPQLQYVWALSSGGSGQERGFGMVLHESDLYISGRHPGSSIIGNTTFDSPPGDYLFMAKLSTDGVWGEVIQSSGSTGYTTIKKIIMDPVGNITNVGSFYGTIQIGSQILSSNGDRDILIFRAGPPSEAILNLSGTIVTNYDPQIGIPNVSVQLQGVQSQNTTTAADGSFSFSQVLSYEIHSLNLSVTGFENRQITFPAHNTDVQLGALVMYEECYPPLDPVASVNGLAADIFWDAPQRYLTGYYVWRLREGQENEENLWQSITPELITQTQITDPGWDSLSYGYYRWAVRAVYTDDRLSPAVFSNALFNIAYMGTISGLVRDQNMATIAYVTVAVADSITRSGANGQYTLTVPQGTHLLQANHPCYAQTTLQNVQVSTGQTTQADLTLIPGVNLLEEDFESYPNFTRDLSPWIMHDLDADITALLPGSSYPQEGLPTAFIIFNPSATIPPMQYANAHSGSKYAASLRPNASSNNDWLMTPLINGALTLRFWARSISTANGWERFRVGLSTGGSDPQDFSIISGASWISAPLAWTEFVYDISAWQDVNIRLGIVCVSTNQFIFAVDDIRVLGSVSNSDPTLPLQNQLLGNFPNPFNPSTTISFELAAPNRTSLRIYNLKGQLVTTLLEDDLSPGSYSIPWNGLDQRGSTVAGGVYLYRLEAGDASFSRKMLMLK